MPTHSPNACHAPNTRTRPARAPAALALRTALAACALTLTACQSPPISTDDERSPYDRYLIARDRYPAPYLEDEFGRKTPNLRGRLLENN